MYRAFRRFAAAAMLAAAALTHGSLDAAGAGDQDAASKSAPLAKELVDLLTKNNITSVAARDPIERDRFIAALFYPGQLMVITGKYTVPVLLDEKISFDKYMDVYVALNGAAVPESKIFIEDQFANGLVATKNTPFDSWVVGEKATLFDGDHRKAKLSRDEYRKLLSDADQQYAKLLELLIAEAKTVKGL
jgi:hypothetical protein